jgi:hypothetical protein
MIMRTCPIGFPLALKINELTPIKDAPSVRKFVCLKKKNEKMIKTLDQAHKRNSILVK